MKKVTDIDKDKRKDKGNKVPEPTPPKCKPEHVPNYYVMNIQDYINFSKRFEKEFNKPKIYSYNIIKNSRLD